MTDVVFENIDTDKYMFKTDKIKLKIKKLSMKEYEEIQDKELEMAEKDKGELTPQDILKLTREWHNFIIEKCIDTDKSVDEIKSLLTTTEFKALVSEVPVFLGDSGYVIGVQRSMKELETKMDSLKNKSKSSQ